MASKVEIANMALRCLGASNIASLTEDSENARKINAIYYTSLRSLLRMHFWNFAMKEVALSQLSDVPILADYSYIYSLPSDYIRLKKTNVEPTYSHKIKGRRVYSNSNALSIEYVAYIEDSTQYDDSFVEAFAAKMAAETCYAITRDKNLFEFKWTEFKEKLRLAKSIDSQEETPDEPTEDEFINARV